MVQITSFKVCGFTAWIEHNNTEFGSLCGCKAIALHLRPIEQKFRFNLKMDQRFFNRSAVAGS